MKTSSAVVAERLILIQFQHTSRDLKETRGSSCGFKAFAFHFWGKYVYLFLLCCPLRDKSIDRLSCMRSKWNSGACSQLSLFSIKTGNASLSLPEANKKSRPRPQGKTLMNMSYLVCLQNWRLIMANYSFMGLCASSPSEFPQPGCNPSL